MRVGQIADALDVPVDYFYADSSVRGGGAGADECLRLWFRIVTPEGRRRALELLRVLSEGGEA